MEPSAGAQQPHRSFIARAGALAVGAAAGQLVVIATLPILTRLYLPEHFGVLGVFSAILGLVAAVSAMRYEMAIPLARTDDDAADVVVLSVLCGAVVAMFVGLFVILFGSQLMNWTHTPDLQRHLWLLPVATGASAVYQALNLWNVRQGYYSRIAATRVYQSTASVATQGTLGLMGVGAVGLVVGQVVGVAGGTLTLARGYRRKLTAGWSARIRVAAQRHKKFPLLAAPAALLSAVSLLLPAVFIAAFFGAVAAGFFILVQRILGAPMGLIGQSVASVYLGDIARQIREGTTAGLHRRYLQLTWRLCLLSSIIIIPLLVIGPDLFSMIFGDDWRQAGVYAQLLALPFGLQLMASPLSQTMNALGRQGWQLMWDAVRGAGVVAAFLCSAYVQWPAEIAIGVYAAFITAMYVALWLLGWMSLGPRS